MTVIQVTKPCGERLEYTSISPANIARVVLYLLRKFGEPCNISVMQI